MLNQLVQKITRYGVACFAIVLLGFFASKYLAVYAPVNTENDVDEKGGREQEGYQSKVLDFDLPWFYFSVSSLAVPDTVSTIKPYDKQALALQLIKKQGVGISVVHYVRLVDSLQFMLQNFEQHHLYRILVASTDFDQIDHTLSQFRQLSSNSLEMDSQLLKLQHALWEIRTNTASWKWFVPVVRYHTDNTFHRWMFGFSDQNGILLSGGLIRGDFGRSYTTGRPVAALLMDKFKKTLALALSAWLLAIVTAIATAVFLLWHADKWWSSVVLSGIFSLYTIPASCVAILFTLILANTYSAVAIGNADVDSALINTLLYKWVFPVLSLNYTIYCYFTIHTHAELKQYMLAEFAKTAQAKGLHKRQIIVKHVLKNALFPLITLSGMAMPYLMSGSVVIESVFAIDGIGSELWRATVSQNFPVLIACFVLLAIGAVTGSLVTDMLLIWADPRIRLKSKYIN